MTNDIFLNNTKNILVKSLVFCKSKHLGAKAFIIFGACMVRGVMHCQVSCKYIFSFVEADSTLAAIPARSLFLLHLIHISQDCRVI